MSLLINKPRLKDILINAFPDAIIENEIQFIDPILVLDSEKTLKHLARDLRKSLELNIPNDMKNELILEKLLKSYEIRKCLFESYHYDTFKVASRKELPQQNYLIFYKVLLLAFYQAEDIRFLNTSFKVYSNKIDKFSSAYTRIKLECLNTKILKTLCET